MNNNIKLKVTDNSSKNDSDIAKYAISYFSRKTDGSENSYKVLTALKANNSIIVEIDSAFLNLSEKDNKAMLSKVTDVFDNLGIKYFKKKITVNQKRTILSFVKEGKKYEGLILLAYIPEDIWNSEEFQRTRPSVGIRYYIIKPEKEMDLSEFFNLDTEERKTLCEMVIFDNTVFQSMGINTEVLNKDDLTELINNIN